MPFPWDKYNKVIYPTGIDTFRLVNNGSTPDSVVDARLVNKITRAVIAVEQHMQYSVATATTSGYYLIVGRGFLQLQSDLPNPGLLQNVPIVVDTTAANRYFNGSPFARQHAILVNGVGYHITGGNRNYFPVRAAVNVGQELGNLTLNVNVVKTNDKWRSGDVVEATVLIARLPAPE